ncbi:MAG: hypothetical protein QNJ44_13330 [Rhodobacter sp.]|nr:hypothetical protein [Rhodobacter sp.]
MPPAANKTPTDRLRDLVRQEIRRAGVGERRFEEQVGLKKWSLRGFLDPERQQAPSLDRAAEIAAALGLNLQIGPQDPGAGLAEPGEDSDLGKREALRAGFLPFPYHSGSGRRGIGPVAFSRAWLDEAGLDPAALSVVAVDQSLLPPAVPDGAMALVDATAPRQGGPARWCFREAGQNYLGFLHWIERGGLLVSGTNGSTPRVLAKGGTGRLQLLGKVVWTGAAAA